jgi:hypothetical protein
MRLFNRRPRHTIGLVKVTVREGRPRMPHALASALAVVIVAANAPAPAVDTSQTPPPSSAIVGGHHIQPRTGAPNGTSAGPDLPPADSDEVERLYQQLMRETAPDAVGTKAPVPSR